MVAGRHTITPEGSVTMTDWRKIGSAPKYKKDGDVPVEFILLLYDPDNEKTYRVQMGFWNCGARYWQSCDEYGELKRPTHWMPLPKPPLR